MRVLMIGAALAASVAVVTPSGAQSPLDGPLAAPDAATPSAPVAPHHTKAKAKKARRAAKAVAMPETADAPRATPAESPHPGAPTDAMDLGMKWNGSNDTAAQTRFQNGPSNAFGSGAEVGMKLHF